MDNEALRRRSGLSGEGAAAPEPVSSPRHEVVTPTIEQHAVPRRAHRYTIRPLTLGLFSVALAIVAQGFIAGKVFLYDGLLLYFIAAVIGLRALVAPQRSGEDVSSEAGARGTEIASTEQIAWLIAAAAVAANLTALGLFGAKTNLNLAWALFACSVLAAPVSVWLLSGRPRLRPLADLTRDDRLALGAILLVALFFRLYRIDSLPSGLWWDEAFSGLEVLRIVSEPTYRPVYVAGMAQEPSLLWYTMIPFFWVFGPSPLGLRATALLAGLLGVVATFLLARELFGRRAGIVASVMVAMMSWHVSFSRIAFNAIWSVTLDAFATYFLVQALRTRRLVTFALAGTVLGLGLNMYYTTRLVPFIMVGYLLHRLVTGRLTFLRQSFVGLLVFAGVTLITISPLAQFAVMYPKEFTARTEQATIIREVDQRQSIAPIVESARRHLLMFNYEGDRNGRHNLPGAPMLDQAIGALFVLGLAMAVLRIRRSEFFLPAIWVPIMLIGGVFSVSFEAPQALRTIDEITAIALLAALPLVALWDRLDDLLDRRIRLPGWLGGSEATALTVSSLVLIGFLAWAGALNYQRYFVQQARDFAVWNAFSTAETDIARQLDELDGDFRVYLGETLIGKPTIVFLSKKYTEFLTFDPTANIPLRDPSNVAIFLEGEHEPTMAMLQGLYPDAEFRTYRSPFGGPPVMRAAIVRRSQVEALQGLTASYYDNARWEGEPLRTERIGAIDLDWSVRPPQPTPFSVEFRSTLVAPAYGQYAFKLEAPTGSELLLDENVLLKGNEETMAILAKGNHSVRLRVPVTDPTRVRLFWRPPNDNELGIVPHDVLFVPPVKNTGLLGSYYRNREWTGPPALQRIDPKIDIRFHLLPLPRPYSVEWRGKIDIPRDGVYQFGLQAIDGSELYINEQLVATNLDAPNQLRENAIQLADGLHDIRVRFVDSTNFTYVRLYWTPPGGERQIVPSERLFPPQGAYLERAPDLILAPSPSPSQSTDGGSPVGGPLKLASYAEALRIGAPGEAVGQFIEPRGVAVDAQGNIYVADTVNVRIQKFDREGKFITAWGKRGEGQADLDQPVAVVVDIRGQVVVLDAEQGWIKRFKPDGTFVDAFGGPTAGFYHPRGLALVPDGSLLVADTGRSRVVRLSPTGEVLGSFGEKGNGPGQIVEPTHVVASSDGSFYVADSANSKVVRFDANWKAQFEWALPKAGSVFGPHLAMADADSILVTDPEGKRIVRYAASGQPLEQIGVEGQLDRPIGLASDEAGALYVADSKQHQIVKLVPRS